MHLGLLKCDIQACTDPGECITFTCDMVVNAPKLLLPTYRLFAVSSAYTFLVPKMYGYALSSQSCKLIASYTERQQRIRIGS